MSDDEWLDSVKVGDRVFVSNRWNGIRPSVVTRLTKTQIICQDDERFHRNGTSRDGGTWHRSYLYQATPERESEYAHQVGLSELARMNWQFLDRADVIAIARQVREMVARKKALTGGNQAANAERAVTPSASEA